MYKVSEAAALSGVTVRALHHYDAIGSVAAVRPFRRRLSAIWQRTTSAPCVASAATRRWDSPWTRFENCLTASAKDRLAAMRNQRDAVRHRAAETAAIVHAINREITAENGGGTQPPDRLGRAQGLVSEYRERSKTESVPQQSALLAEALDVLRPLTTGAAMDAAAVRLAVWIHHLRHDYANLADLCRRFLDQEPDWEERRVRHPRTGQRADVPGRATRTASTCTVLTSRR